MLTLWIRCTNLFYLMYIYVILNKNLFVLLLATLILGHKLWLRFCGLFAFIDRPTRKTHNLTQLLNIQSPRRARL